VDKGRTFHFTVSLDASNDAGLLDTTGWQSQTMPPSQKSPAEQQARALTGMRILVEDNLLNQQVAEELLSNQGAIVALAANGQLGLEAVQQASPPFDVVLMDLQMPVLDGFGATQRIRTQWDMHQLPIIAMTANAMAADREACLAAGMNEHIGKPFDLRHLVDKLVEHTGWASHYTPAPTVTVGAVESVTWPASIDVAEAIERMGGNSALYRKSIQTFLVELQGLLPRLCALHAANDTPALLLELHSLKGLAATLGVVTLSSFAAQAEQTARLTQGYSHGLLDGLAVEV
jgi:CheY-like chemotaxis protein